MDFKQLESFIQIAKYGSFSKAADALYLTQPTISNHIHQLENELQITLLIRGSKSVTLTEAGEILFYHATNILNERENALFDLNRFKGSVAGTLVISYSAIPEQFFLTDILYAFSKQYQDIHYQFDQYDSKKIIQLVVTGHLDFGFVSFKEPHQFLTYHQIEEDEIVLIASPKRHRKLESIQDLTRLPLIMQKEHSGTRALIEDRLAAQGLSLDAFHVISTADSQDTIKNLVEHDFGLAFMSKNAIVSELEDQRLKIIPLPDFKIKRNFYFVYHNRRILCPLSETFKEFIQSKDR